jgi:hypothetical protein
MGNKKISRPKVQWSYEDLMALLAWLDHSIQHDDIDFSEHIVEHLKESRQKEFTLTQIEGRLRHLWTCYGIGDLSCKRIRWGDDIFAHGSLCLGLSAQEKEGIKSTLQGLEEGYNTYHPFTSHLLCSGLGLTKVKSNRCTSSEYTVGWICVLEVEQIAALEILDEEHERLPQSPIDHNTYTLGSIGGHNVVIAGLHTPGNNSASVVVTQMRNTFQNLRFCLLVGIGGSVPTKTNNGIIRLGDVVVSKPVGEHSGVVQYDHGKAETGYFRRTGALAPPPAVLLNAAQHLAVQRARTRKGPDLRKYQKDQHRHTRTPNV